MNDTEHDSGSDTGRASASEHGPFTHRERAALDLVQILEPPVDFADRTIARFLTEESRRSSWNYRAVIGGGCLAVGLIALAASVFGLSIPREGSERVAARMSIPIGRRAVVVAEAGTELRWRIGVLQDAEIEQSGGDAFYRVEHGGRFLVRTPYGEVRVVGTCFRVEVAEMKVSSAAWAGTAAGAAIASVALVSVYEGGVVTASPKGELAVGAGETVLLEGGRAPVRKAEPKSGARSAAMERVDPSRDLAAAEGSPSGSEGGVLAPGASLARAMKAGDLEAKIEALEKKLAEAKGNANKTKTYDLDPAELKEMAQRCELRWDMVGLSADPPDFSESLASEIGLSDDERRVVERAFATSHKRAVDDVRKIYVEVTGDEGTGSLAAEAMFAEINDKAPEGELKRIFQKLARERAGLEPRPTDLTKTGPVERMYRTLTGSGDALESDLASELGPESARRVRDLRGGFNSKSRSSHGCPSYGP